MQVSRLRQMVSGFNQDLPPNIDPVLEAHEDGTLTLAGRYVGEARSLSEWDVCERFEHMQAAVIERELLSAWPRCPEHGTHPLLPEPDGWMCPQSEKIWPFGTHAVQDLPDAIMYPDDVVKWTLRGWGLIANSAGDLWFQTAGTEFLEGDPVTYEVDEAMQGRLRRARSVRKI